MFYLQFWDILLLTRNLEINTQVGKLLLWRSYVRVWFHFPSKMTKVINVSKTQGQKRKSVGFKSCPSGISGNICKRQHMCGAVHLWNSLKRSGQQGNKILHLHSIQKHSLRISWDSQHWKYSKNLWKHSSREGIGQVNSFPYRPSFELGVKQKQYLGKCGSELRK